MKSLPSDSTDAEIDHFISTSISLVCNNIDQKDSTIALSVFLRFLKDDGK